MKQELKAIHWQFRPLMNRCVEQMLKLRLTNDTQALLAHLDDIQRRLDEIRELVKEAVEDASEESSS